MHLRSSRSLALPLSSVLAVALCLPSTLVACGGTVVFEEDGGSDGGGGFGERTTSGSGGDRAVTGATTGPVTSGGPTSTAAFASSGAGPSSITVGVTAGVTTGGLLCDEVLFGDPDLDACAGNFCCAEKTVCLNDLSLCFNDSGEIATDRPDGAAFYDCLLGSGCLQFDKALICDSGLSFGGEVDPETRELARCLSDNCCEEFNFCTSDASDADSCIRCLNGETKDDSLCRPAIDCANDICDGGF